MPETSLRANAKFLTLQEKNSSGAEEVLWKAKVHSREEEVWAHSEKRSELFWVDVGL